MSAAVEGKNRPVATNFQFLKMLCSTGTSLLQCVCISEVILLGRACPKPCSSFVPSGTNGTACRALHISDVIKSRAIPRKAYDSGLWGLSIKTKERMQTTPQKTLPFGVVVTLKEMSGVNRIEDFKRLCMARGWLVSELNVQNQLDIYLRAEENLDLE